MLKKTMLNVTHIINHLDRAKELLAKPNGYIKGSLYNARGGFCALGALEQVAGWDVFRECAPELVALDAAIPKGTREDMEAGKIIDQSHRRHPDGRVSRIACYNNNTDQATVVNWFQRAADILREHPMEKA